MKILSWNVKGIRGIGPRRLDKILDAIASAEPDIITLQEVSARFDLWQRFRDGLADRSFANFFFSGRPRARQKRYGNVIASVHEIIEVDQKWAPDAPWRQLVARALVNVPELGPVDVITAHMPNGSGNGWKKIDTFEALAGYLDKAEDMPRIVTGDFNEPHRITKSGRLVTFGETVRTKKPTLEGSLTRKDSNGKVETHPRRRWDGGVNSVLARDDLRHVYFATLRRPSFACTYVTRTGSDRFFDHILVSEHFEVVNVGFKHRWRTRRLSDHSAAWVELDAR